MKTYHSWTEKRAVPIQGNDIPAEELERRAKNRDAGAYYQLGSRALFQNHPGIAYDLYLKAMAVGVTTPVVAFVPLAELQATQPKSSGSMLRQMNLAWALVAAMRGDEYGARLVKFTVQRSDVDPVRTPAMPVNQILSACQMAAKDYRTIQQMRAGLGLPPFTAADNAPQTAFMDEANPWPVTICPDLPIPEMRCEQVQLVGQSKGLRIPPGHKPYECVVIKRPALPAYTSVSDVMAPNVQTAPAPALAGLELSTVSKPEIMRPVSTEPLGEDVSAPDSGSDSDPEVQYHFSFGPNLYVIESGGSGVVNGLNSPQRHFEVPSAPVFIDGPIYKTRYESDVILLYQADMPEESAEQKRKDALVYLVRLQTSDLTLKWTISGISPGVAPGVISGSTVFVAADNFLGAVNLDTGKYRWCLPDFGGRSQHLFEDVSAPVIQDNQVVVEQIEPNAWNGHYYLAVNLEKLVVHSNAPLDKLPAVTTDCPYFR